MADLNTKQKILLSSIQLINEQGMANVRLQQIADHLGISVGNLAYHFKNKQAIIAAINEYLSGEVSKILSTYRIYPNLMDFDSQLNQYFSFIKKYPFFFLDSLKTKRQYPQIHEQQKAQIAKMIHQIKMRLEYNQERGMIRMEARKGIYRGTTNAIWMLISHWLPQKILQGKPHHELRNTFKEMVWNQIYPHLTEKGMTEYEMLIIPALESQHRSGY